MLSRLIVEPGVLGVWQYSLSGSADLLLVSGVLGSLCAIGGESLMKSSMVSMSAPERLPLADVVGCSVLMRVPLTLLRTRGCMLFLRFAPPRGMTVLSTA